MSYTPESRFRIRYILIAIILATLPCYCAGLFMVNLARRQSALPVNPAPPSPTWTQPIDSPSDQLSPAPTLAPSATQPSPTPTLTETPTPTPTSTETPTITPSEAPPGPAVTPPPPDTNPTGLLWPPAGSAPWLDARTSAVAA